MNPTSPSTHNDNADELFSRGEYSRALAAFQQLFLNWGKAAEPQIRAQVARALYNAARCYEHLDKPEMAAQIRDTLFARYGNDDNPRTRYWVELAQGGSTPDAAMTTKSTPGTNAAQEWEEFLRANDLTDDVPETSALETSALETSALETSAPETSAPRQPATFIAEDEVSLSRLKSIFDGAFIECEIEDDTLRIVYEGTKFFLHRNQPHRLLTLVAFFGLREDAAENEKLELVNSLNRELILVRFFTTEENSFVADVTLSYAQGLAPFQLVNALRLMQRIVQSAGQYDPNDLLI